MTPEFHAGEIIHLRHFQREVVSAVYSGRVVHHDADGLLIWFTEGTRYWFLYMSDGREMRATPLPEWAAAPKVMRAYPAPESVLSWHPVGADYSVRYLFRDGRFVHWYANLEASAVAWPDQHQAGLDTVDWDLDLWIGPDRSWRWKDEEEFAERLRWPQHYWVGDPDKVRRAGHEAIALAEAGVFRFDGTWCDFLPDPAWTPIVEPGPPNGWDRPRAHPTGG